MKSTLWISLYFGAAAPPAYKSEDLYITGYSGCAAVLGSPDYVFPWAYPGTQPSGDPYFYVAGFSNYAYNVFISRFEINMFSGIQENSHQDVELLIFPNPTNTGEIKVEFPNMENGVCQVLNTLGEVILSGTIINTDNLVISTDSFSPGFYIINMTDIGNSSFSGAFIKY